MKKFNYKSRKGFTLIELLVVIGILAVLAAIAIPSVAGLIDRANVSSDDTNANEMTNAIERFTSEYELFCQDIASGKLNTSDLDAAQSRVYNVTGADDRGDIEKLENSDLNGKKLNKDTKYPENYDTAVAIVQNYTKTSSSTFEPKQSDMHFWYSPDCGVVVYGEPESSTSVLNQKIISGKDAKGKELTGTTRWIDLTTGEETDYVANYNSSQIENNPLLFGIGKTSPEYVLAEFNEDFTEVTIFKNGANSDGLVMDWNPSTSGIKSPMYEHKDTLIKATYKEGVTNTGIAAFNSCANLTNITLSETITIMDDYTFSGCKSLTTINLPSKVLTLGRYLFSNCTKLKNIVVPETAINWKMGVFHCCSALETINIPNGIETLPDDAFAYCSKLNNVVIPNSVTKLDTYAFYSCRALTNITIPNSIVEISGNVFESCVSLEKIVLPEGLMEIGTNVFSKCTNLKEVTLPASLQSLGFNVFTDCPNLEKFVMLTNEDNEILRNFGFSQFSTTNNLKTIILPDNKIRINNYDLDTTGFYKDRNNWTSDNVLYCGTVLIDCDNTTDTNITVKNGTISIAGSAFRKATSVTSVTVPESVKYMNPATFNNSNVTTVYGKAGSYAETFAIEQGLTFVAQ